VPSSVNQVLHQGTAIKASGRSILYPKTSAFGSKAAHPTGLAGEPSST